jgi:hypothetical protein
MALLARNNVKLVGDTPETTRSLDKWYGSTTYRDCRI